VRYEVRLRRAAQQRLEELTEQHYEIVTVAVRTLEENPRAIVHKLADSGLWRIRVGLYRIICAIDDEAQSVTILALTHHQKPLRK